MSTPLRASIGPLGDQAMLLTLEGDREQCNRAIVRLAAALRDEGQADAHHAIVDVVPALISLAVFYDPRLVPSTAIERRLRDLADRVDHLGDAGNVGRLHVVPVRYDGSDLSEVARTAGLDPRDVVRRHAAREYRVRFLGFAPGFAYLGPLDPALVVPRRSEPRRRIPAGSVAIAGDQTAIYPLDTPGGWHLIGHTDLRPFDLSQAEPIRFATGDRVRFEPVEL